MADVNKHGLSRSIPADKKLAVRRACGFGCVLCGSALIEYEHVEPPFSEALSHDPDRMALLCPQCHSKVTRGFVSKKAVSEGRASPICKEQGFASEAFAIGRTVPVLVIGGDEIRNCPVPLLVGGVPLLKIRPGEEVGAPVRLSGVFHNAAGELSLVIEDNEWQPVTDNWDVEFVGGAMTVRDGPGKVSLRVRFELPDRLVFERIDMRLNGFHIDSAEGLTSFTWPNGANIKTRGNIASNRPVGLKLDPNFFALG